MSEYFIIQKKLNNLTQRIYSLRKRKQNHKLYDYPLQLGLGLDKVRELYVDIRDNNLVEWKKKLLLHRLRKMEVAIRNIFRPSGAEEDCEAETFIEIFGQEGPENGI